MSPRDFVPGRSDGLGAGGVYRSTTAGPAGAAPASRGTVYGGARSSGASGTVYGGGTTYGTPSGPAATRPATTYGRPAGTTYGSGPAGVATAPSVPTRRQTFLDEQDRLTPEVGGSGTKPPKKRSTGKKVLKIGGFGIAITMLLGIAVCGVAYAVVDLPFIPPKPQATTVTYDDGNTEKPLATFASENRNDVKLDQVPVYVQNAVIAAEDATFWDNNEGVSVKGTGRAIIGLVTGKDAGGGSTITQQYIRNALNLTKERSYKRKAKEIILAQKLARSKSKKEILEAYLNTIYYGRRASGIQAASKAYFGIPVDKLTIAQGVVLASVIKDPTNFDPRVNLAGARGRWDYVLGRMATKGFISSAERIKQVYPQTIARDSTTTASWRLGSSGVLAGRIENELRTKLGFSEQYINTAGITVITTVNRGAQKNAKAASERYLKGESTAKHKMATAMVSIDPRNGMVKAYYGGEDGYGTYDLADNPHPAGSSFKPYVLATGVSDGYSIDSLWDGSSPQTLPGRSNPLRNSDNDNSCGTQCSLTRATVKSLNTVYWALADKVGPKNVAKTAAAAGIKTLNGKPIAGYRVDNSIGIGQYGVTPLDQASGYATIAANGTYHEPFFIDRIIDSDGKSVLWSHADHATPSTQAYTLDVGKDVSYVLQQVYEASKKHIGDGRPAAGKTGTQQLGNTDENSHAWMCGYTPQLATAVWVGSKGDDFALKDILNGGKRVYGSGIPQSIWRQFMSTTLVGNTKAISFDDPLHAGDQPGNAPSVAPPPDPQQTDQDPVDGTEQPDPGQNPQSPQPDPGQDPGNNNPFNPFGN